MSKRILYYLVGRDRKTNDFQVIPIAGKRGNLLEEIDLYTTNYESVWELMKVLKSQNIIKSMDMDFFIVSQKEEKGEKTLSFQDLLFKDSYQIRDIAVASKNHDIESANRKIQDILNHFCHRMKYNPVFYNMVVYGDTHLYPEFVKHFANRRYDDFYKIKYVEGGWPQRSYVLLRNILDSFHQNDYSFGKNDHFELDYVYRELLEDYLLEITEEEYDEKQSSIFDLAPTVSDEDKVIEIMETFRRIPTGVFLQKGNEVVFNTKLFGEYDEDDQEKLSSLLGGRLSLLVQMNAYHNHYLEEAESAMRDTSKYEQKIELDEKNIYNAIQDSPDILNQAYQWILIYQKYCNRVVGDEFEHGYQRRKEKRRSQ